MSTIPSPAQTAIRAVLDTRRQQPGALLPVLHDIQDRLGHVPPEAVPETAEALNLSRAEGRGFIYYYHHFRSEPRMRRDLLALLDEGGTGVLPLVREALGRHRALVV